MAHVPGDPVDLSKIPLSSNPDGSPPNFTGGQSLETVNLVVGVMIIALSAVVVTIRIYAGFKNVGRLFLDDFLCVTAEITTIVYFGLFSALAAKGLVKHAWDLPVSVIDPWLLKRHVVSQFFGAFGNWFAKASLLAFFLRIFSSLRWVHIACYGLLILLSMGTITHAGLFAVLCVPYGREVWDANLMAKCAIGAPGTLTVGVCTLVVDLAIFVLPFPIISRLNMDKKKKQGLLVVFLIGFSIIVTSTVGLAYRVIVMKDTVDPTWNGANVSITMYVDTFGSIIVSCAPGIYAWWLKIFSHSWVYASFRSMSLLRSRNSPSGSNVYGTNDGKAIPVNSDLEDGHFKHPKVSTSSSQDILPVSPRRDNRHVIPVSTIIVQTISDRTGSYEESYRMQEYTWQPSDARMYRNRDDTWV